jgi:hypothetical protein
VLRGEKDKVRDGVLYGTFGQGACWVDDDVTFFSGFDNERQPAYWYGTNIERSGPAPDAESGRHIPGVDMPVWRYRRTWCLNVHTKLPPQVYARDDAEQRNDLIEDRTLLARCREKLRAAIKEEGAPPETFRRLLLDQG